MLKGIFKKWGNFLKNLKVKDLEYYLTNFLEIAFLFQTVQLTFQFLDGIISCHDDARFLFCIFLCVLQQLLQLTDCLLKSSFTCWRERTADLIRESTYRQYI